MMDSPRVLRLLSTGLVANLIYVLSGTLKQYFIAAQLRVEDVGVYGGWVAQASLLLVLVPFPAYLDVLIKGFSAPPDDNATRSRLISSVVGELRLVVIGASIVILCSLAYGFALGELHRTSVSLALLLIGQYVSLTADILLRMRQAHQHYAVFMATRNLPSLALIIALGLRSPLAVALAELLAAMVTGWFVYRSRPLRQSIAVGAQLRQQIVVAGEQVTLWLARLVQYVNSALLRLIVPFVFAAHETGLFFFAVIAQIPSALFLSVTTQVFGHALARIEPGQYKTIARIQGWFLLPNALYMLLIALIVPYWAVLIGLVPTLTQYSEIGSLVFAVALYSSVLSSDCQEYLLRSRGLSRILLQYNLCSITAQIACLALCAYAGLRIERTIVLCALVAASVLIAFSMYSFLHVLGRRVTGEPT